MKKIIGFILNILLILTGGSLIAFILKMIWLPPSPMGMMMNRYDMYDHMGSWMQGTFFVFVIFVILIITMILLKEWNDR